MSNGLANTICTTSATTTSTASSERPAVVIENYKNGYSWYRIWSDGWIEQGGVIDTSSSVTGTLKFLKPYSTSYYTVSLTPLRGDSSHPITAWVVLPYTATSFDFAATPSYTGAILWIAEGY